MVVLPSSPGGLHGVVKLLTPRNLDVWLVPGSDEPRLEGPAAGAGHQAGIHRPASERATEAAAATRVQLFPGMAMPMVPFQPTFQADRPFVYLIRDRKTGTVLFLGRVADPLAG